MIKCNLAVLLAERGLKMSDVIKDTGIAKTTVRALYYNSSQGIQFDTLETLCNYLDVTPGELLLYHPLRFTLGVKNKEPKEIANEGDVYFDLQLNIKPRSVKGEVKGHFVVTILEESAYTILGDIIITIYFSPDVYEELKNIPVLFRQDIEKEIESYVLSYCPPDIRPAHISVFTDVLNEK